MAEKPKYLIYTNFYKCSECGETWEDTWSCACDDRCPSCNTEMQPHESTVEAVSEGDLPKGIEAKDCQTA